MQWLHLPRYTTRNNTSLVSVSEPHVSVVNNLVCLRRDKSFRRPSMNERLSDEED